MCKPWLTVIANHLDIQNNLSPRNRMQVLQLNNQVNSWGTWSKSRIKHMFPLLTFWCCFLHFGVSGIVSKLSMVLLVGVFAWSYNATRPPPPNICGTPNGPPVTSSRIKLNDGRHLSYIETGVSKDKARHKIIFLHSFDCCKHDLFPVSQVMIMHFLIHRDCSFWFTFFILLVMSVGLKFSGNAWWIWNLLAVFWQSWLWGEWSKSEDVNEKHCWRCWGTCW